MNSFEDRYLTTRHVAEMTGFSVRALEARRHRGLRPAFIRLGRTVRYRLSDVVAWMESSADAVDK